MRVCFGLFQAECMVSSIWSILFNKSSRKLVYPRMSRRFISTISNKRITRLESDIELQDAHIESRIINRNPRNLEQLSLEKKPAGFWLDKAKPMHWNTLVLEQRGKHLITYLEHWSKLKLVEASTDEPALKKYFPTAGTVQAASTLGQIIARRCLQSGYLCAGKDDVDVDSTKSKTTSFYQAVEASGFTLAESPEIVPRNVTDL